jgi:hypothetical protein
MACFPKPAASLLELQKPCQISKAFDFNALAARMG